MLLTPLLLLTPMVGFKYKTGSKQNNEFLLYICILTIKKKKKMKQLVSLSDLVFLDWNQHLDWMCTSKYRNKTSLAKVMFFFAC